MTSPNAHTPSTESAGIEPGSRSTCLNCSEPIVYDARDGWIHPDLVGIGVLGGDGVACDINPVAEPGDVVLPPGPSCDCDYWHSQHRWHCATRYPAASEIPASPDSTDGGA